MNNAINILDVSVTELADFSSRSGNLSHANINSISMAQGTILHQKVFKELKKDFATDNSFKIITEYQLKYAYIKDDITLNIKGRADAVLIDNSSHINEIIEIKSHNLTGKKFDDIVRPEHMTQLKIYGALYLLAHDINSVKLSLRYVSITTLEAIMESFVFDKNEAKIFLDILCDSYLSFATKILNYNVSSIQSIKDLSFPYDKIRSGQAQFMKQTLVSLTSNEALFVEAPTGTGKTISTLYPAIKGLLRDKYKKIFYLTAKTATREVAVKALEDMRKKGLILRSILLMSKEQICPKQQKCDTKFCKYAKKYYSKLKDAINDLFIYDNLTPELIKKVA